MWLQYNGQQHKVLNPIHIKRLKEEGAIEIDDPIAQISLEAPEQSTEPLGSPDDSTQQESQDKPPVGDPSALPQEDSKKPKRSSKA